MNNYEPAFPRPASPAHQYGMHKPQEGMTIRDYFAAKAMQPLIVSFTVQDINWTAQQAYKIADAMLQARNA